jgi:PhnB protein
MTDHVRHARGSVRPYLFGHLELPAFLCEVFGAKELERHDMGPESSHVELAIGDSVVVVEAGRLPDSVTPTQASVYVYVPDVDAAYERALKAGATSLSEPEDKHYSERSAAIKDASGNTWYISTFLSG